MLSSSHGNDNHNCYCGPSSKVHSWPSPQVSTEFTNVAEGGAVLVVPAESLTKKAPPKSPAFFNPAAKLSRDISSLVYRSFISLNDSLCTAGPVTFADPFSGIGARSVRVAVEVPAVDKVFLNDINPVAISAAKKAAEINGVEERCVFSQSDVYMFLNDRRSSHKRERYAIVDLDPFGSPSPYMDSLLRAVTDGGLISVTATDNPVLYGKYPKVCFRKYYGRPINCTYSNEIAIRILTSFISLVAGRMEISIKPIFAHSDRHYSRVYAKVHVSSNEANQLTDNLGYVTHCFGCGDRKKYSFLFPPVTCKICEKKLCVVGPLWIKSLFDRPMISHMLNWADNSNGNHPVHILPVSSMQHGSTHSGTTRLPSLDPTISNAMPYRNYHSAISRLLERAYLELDELPYYYTVDEIGSLLKTSPRPMEEILDAIAKEGFQISRTSFRPTGFKTSANLEEIKGLLG